MAKTDPNDFLLNTDYEMDKIIYFKEGSIEPGNIQTFPSGFNFAPLLFGVCSYTSDFSDTYSFPYTLQTSNSSVSFRVSADIVSYVVKVQYSVYPNTQQKMYYRLYGFEPSNSSSKIPPTSNYAKNFILNTGL